MTEMIDLALLLQKDAGWIRNVDYIDTHLIETGREHFRSELAVLKSSVLFSSLDIVEIVCELLLSNIAAEARLVKGDFSECDSHAAREAADAKLAKKSSDANKTVALQKR